MTKARTLASFDATGVLTSTSTLNPAKLDTAGTIPSELLAGVGGGKLLQLKQEIFTTQVNKAATSFTNLEHNGDTLAVTITPTASDSKIYINYTIQANHASNRGYRSRIVQNINGANTPVLEMSNQKDTYGDGDSHQGRSSVQYLDSPATTDAVTYTIQVATDGANAVTFAEGNSPCMITVMEIAA